MHLHCGHDQSRCPLNRGFAHVSRGLCRSLNRSYFRRYLTGEIGKRDGGFYVEDDGPGIAEDEREQVFEAGYSSSHHGTGFGLSIVQEIVEAHDWDIRVTDSSDGGARFEITGVEYVDQ